MSTPTTAPAAMPTPQPGQRRQISSSKALVGRSQCRAQSG